MDLDVERYGAGELRDLGVRLLNPVYRRAGSAYLAGPDQLAAMVIAERLVAAGSDVTLGYWPWKAEPADSVTARTAATIEALRAHGERASLAVKAHGLAFDVATVQRLAHQAAQSGVRLVFDAHSPQEAERTYALARAALAEGARVGVALPARWTRSFEDAAMAAEEGLSVRLVKGQWADDARRRPPAGDDALRACYLALLERLLDQRVLFSVATHDAGLLSASLRRMAAAGATPRAELLLGLPVRRVLSAAVSCGARVAFYVGFGHPGLPYPFTSVLRRPRLARMLTQGVLLGTHNQRIQVRAALLREPRGAFSAARRAQPRRGAGRPVHR